MVFTSFKNYNFRLYFWGQLVSMSGTWTQVLAASWLAYRLTHSGFWLGVISFFSQAPVFFIGPFAGAVVDRLNRHKLLIVTQFLAMVQAFVLAYFTFSGIINIYSLLILSMILGIINAFDMPVRQTFVTNIIERENLPNAVALNATAMNFSRMVGPVLAGIIVAQVGEGACFAVNGLSFLAALLSLVFMKNLDFSIFQKEKENMFKEIKDGILYVWRHPVLKTFLLALAAVSFAAAGQTVIMPIFVSDVLKSGPKTLGVLMGSSGLGAFLGSFYLAGRKNARGLAVLIGRAVLILSLCFFFFAFSRSLLLASSLLFIIGFGSLFLMAGTNTMFQLTVEEIFRGRVMGFYTMTFVGLAPIGGLLGGLLVAQAGVAWTLVVFSLILFLVGFWVNLMIKKISV